MGAHSRRIRGTSRSSPGRWNRKPRRLRSPPTPMARKLASIAGMHRIDAKDLALAVGVSHQSAKQWLNGAYAPAGVNLENLASSSGLEGVLLPLLSTTGDASRRPGCWRLLQRHNNVKRRKSNAVKGFVSRRTETEPTSQIGLWTFCRQNQFRGIDHCEYGSRHEVRPQRGPVISDHVPLESCGADARGRLD